MQQVNSQTSIPKAQALFIYNFTRLIEWPEAYKSGDFVIGIVGGGGLANELNSALSGKSVSQQAVKLVTFNDVSEIIRCHIIVVPFGKSNQFESIIAKLGNQGTLVISEKKGLLDKGSIINFVIEGNALKFELNKAEAQKRGLTINSTLEKMAVTN